MTVFPTIARATLRSAAAAAASMFARFNVGPPPAPTPAPRSPSANGLHPRKATAGAAPFVAAPRVAAPSASTVPAAGQRLRPAPSHGAERRGRAERRHRGRRRADHSSPYGTERRSGADDRRADRRGGIPVEAGIGLTRDYFAQANERAPDVAGTTIPRDLLVRFHG